MLQVQHIPNNNKSAVRLMHYEKCLETVADQLKKALAKKQQQQQLTENWFCQLVHTNTHTLLLFLFE